MSKPSFLRRALSFVWAGITRVRLAMSNILFLLMLVFIYFVYLGGGPEPLPARYALLLNMSGTVVDQKSPVDPLVALISEPSAEDHEVLLKDVLDAIDFAADDPAVNALVMELDALMYVGISKTQEIIAALDRFRETGKPILAVGDYYSQGQYLLASQADEIIMHPMGGVSLEGFSSYRNYFRGALEKLSVTMHVFRAGDLKSAVEPYIRDDMSPEEKEVTSRWLQELWVQYTNIVESQRELEEGSVDEYINNFPERLAAAGGDTGKAAFDEGLVDNLMSRREANDYIAEIVGARDEDDLYEAVVFERYVARKRPLSLSGPEGDRVAVITAQGTMLPGDQPPGTIGGDSLARLIRSTAEEEGVAAIVLRVSSGGGSMFASEIIRQELLYAQGLGLPVVISMGSVAASGGYYIAAEADEIWATPSTITGSIGVFAAFPTFENLLERVGVHTDGVGTTELAGSLRIDRPLSPEITEAFNSSVAFAYETFLQIVSEGRGISLEQMDALAQGRVWSADAALENGLVDRIGSLEEAIESSAALAGLEDYEVDYVELPLSARDQLLKQLANRSAELGLLERFAVEPAVHNLLRPLAEARRELELLQDPGHLYLRCVGCALVR
jgi:protease IV